MFLDDAHRTTRNYKSLRDKIGKEIFCKGHRLEPYYTAALAYYRLESLFRLRRIEPKYKPARFHILMAIRLMASKEPPPRTNSNAMASYSEELLKILWNQTEGEQLILSAVDVVSAAAAGDFRRDSIRTEPFTKKVKAVAAAKASNVKS
jgi:hypothetical protein